MTPSKRVAIVTGAGGGLGGAFATALARDGLAVLVSNRHRAAGPASAELLADRLRAEGLIAVADRHAVDAAGAAQAIIGAALDAFGRLDVLVLNAGISGVAGKIGPELAPDLAQILAVNFVANAALVSAALPYLRASPSARIVFVSSTAGLHGLRGRAAYAASKGALTAYALTLADEQRRTGIGVNIVMPYAETKMTEDAPDGALVAFAPQKVAPLISWLASEDCADTGERWVAGGGRWRRAYMVETRGGVSIDAAGRAAIADREGARSYPGGDAAFADMLADVDALTLTGAFGG